MFDHREGKCKGVCTGLEEINNYNERVESAVESLNKKLSTRFIIDEGRDFDERSIVLIEQGVYKGFGYFPADMTINNAESARDFIQPYKHNPDVQRILNKWLVG